MNQPTWLDAAWAEFGVREKPGTSNDPRVLNYYREAGHNEVATDETPWCAAFVGAMLARSGVAHSGSLMARSYLRWGVALDAPRVGALAVLTRGSDPFAGHVGFFVGATGDRIFLLGGNQNDAVTVAAFDAARLIGYRWPTTTDALGAAPLPSEAQGGRDHFADALAHVLEMEGGFSDDPYDPGGPTNKGITLATFAKWRGETLTAQSRSRLIDALKRIDDDTVAAIFHARYWEPASCAALSGGLALMHFDAAVNHGVGGAIRMLQTALRVEADGEIGPRTLAACAAMPEQIVIERYGELRRGRYRGLPHFWRFGRGWLRRVDATEWRAKHMSNLAKGVPSMDQEFKFPLPGEIPAVVSAGSETAEPGKWWAHSKTVWGALITTAATVLPIIGPLIGIHLPADVITKLGDQTVVVVQAIAGLIGTVLTLYGRSQADTRLVRKDVKLRM
jgi:uncharacterized protein (TIGR02594 family)